MIQEITETRPTAVDSFREADFAIRGAWAVETGRNRRSMLIGWYGYRMKLEDKFPEHGYKDEADYRDRVGVSRAVWGRMIRVASFFEFLAVDQFTAMTAENAEILSTLPTSYRYDLEWLGKAKTLKAEDFKREVLRAKADYEGVPVADMRVIYKLKVFEAQRTVITAAVTDFRRENNLIDEGTALEWMAMEVSGRRTFAQFLKKQIPVLREALRGGDARAALGEHVVALAELLDNYKTEKSK